MNVEQQMLDLFKKMESSLETIARHSGVSSGSGTGSGGGRTGSSALDEAAQELFERELRLSSKTLGALNVQMKKSVKSAKSLVVSMNDGDAAEKEKAEAIQKVATSHFTLADRTEALATEYNKLARQSLPQQHDAMKNLVRGTTGLTNAFSQSARKAGLLGAAMIKRSSAVDSDTSSIDYARHIQQLQDASKHIPASMLMSAKLIEDYTDDFGNVVFKDGLTREDFANLRAQMGEAEVILHEAFAGVADASDILSKGIAGLIDENANKLQDADFTKAVVAAAVELKKSGAGVDLGLQLNEDGTAITNLEAWTDSVSTSTEELEKVVRSLDAFYKGIDKSKVELDELGEANNTVIGFVKRHFGSEEGLSNSFKRFAGDLATTAGTFAALARFKEKFKVLADEVSDFNVAGISASFADATLMSVAMGMSFKETSELIQENKRLVGLYGSDAFASLQTGLEDTFNQFGYTFKQAAGLIGPATEAAIAAGVNIKDSNALNKYMGQTMQSFQKMNKLVGISAAEYGKLNAELFNSPEVFNTMLGMTVKQSQQYAKNLESQRLELVQRGMSVQQAQELIKAQEAAKRAKVMDRVKGGAMMQMQMLQAGFSPEEAQRAMDIHMKGRRASKSETAELLGYAGQLRARQEASISDPNIAASTALTREFTIERLNQGSALDTLFDQAASLSRLRESNVGATDEELLRMMEQGGPSTAWMHVTETMETASSIINNAFVGAVTSGATALLALTLSAGTAARALGMIGGRGLFGSLGKMARGAGGAGGAIARGAGGVIARGAGVIGGLLGMGGGAAAAGGIGRIAAGIGAMHPLGRLALVGGGLLAGSSMMGLGDSVQPTDKGGSFWGSVLSGAGTGASGGLFLGPKGAIIGAVGGGIIGGAAHLWNNRSTAKPAAVSPESLTVADPVNKEQVLQAPGGILSVKDADAQTQLVIIAEQITEAVRLLNEMANSEQRPAARSIAASNLRPALPTSTSFISGRAM